jgi:hypothetical protein
VHLVVHPGGQRVEYFDGEMREAGTDERIKMTPGNAKIRELGTGETRLARRAMRVPFQHAGERAGASAVFLKWLAFPG